MPRLNTEVKQYNLSPGNQQVPLTFGMESAQAKAQTGQLVAKGFDTVANIFKDKWQKQEQQDREIDALSYDAFVKSTHKQAMQAASQTADPTKVDSIWKNALKNIQNHINGKTGGVYNIRYKDMQSEISQHLKRVTQKQFDMMAEDRKFQINEAKNIAEGTSLIDNGIKDMDSEHIERGLLILKKTGKTDAELDNLRQKALNAVDINKLNLNVSRLENMDFGQGISFDDDGLTGKVIPTNENIDMTIDSAISDLSNKKMYPSLTEQQKEKYAKTLNSIRKYQKNQVKIKDDKIKKDAVMKWNQDAINNGGFSSYTITDYERSNLPDEIKRKEIATLSGQKQKQQDYQNYVELQRLAQNYKPEDDPSGKEYANILFQIKQYGVRKGKAEFNQLSGWLNDSNNGTENTQLINSMCSYLDKEYENISGLDDDQSGMLLGAFKDDLKALSKKPGITRSEINKEYENIKAKLDEKKLSVNAWKTFFPTYDVNRYRTRN